MILSNIKTKLLWWIFFKCAKEKWKWHKAAAVFCLELKTQKCWWRLHMSVTNLHVSILSKCSLPILLWTSILSETVTPIWVANALVVSTILLLCYARSCFLQQEISTFWPNSSKHLLRPLILEGPISSVYHLLFTFTPHYFGPTFCQRPFFFGLKRNIKESLLDIWFALPQCFGPNFTSISSCPFCCAWPILFDVKMLWARFSKMMTTFDDMKLPTKEIRLMST